MQEGSSVSHLVARVLHAGVPGGHANMRPVVYDRGHGGMTFELVQYDDVRNVLGRVPVPYHDMHQLITEISHAHVKWGYPTAAALAEAFPNGRIGG